ncbi:MAG TPA: 16S rRNA (cytidine(1402)-2'-O)-methyltransferase [Actinomycetales bacterium]|nr:16S rRNA (cytidine(1402)-2'-O)-methyltransferase [Actinomycetales bacterium]
MDGRLVLAGTPIGDVTDAPPRLAELIATADVVAAEDTRRLRRLAAALGVTPSGKVVSFHEHNETARAQELVEEVRAGRTVLVVTDAGMPSVSDPGYRVVDAAVRAGVHVTAVPGPSAVLTALALSGLPTDRFCFEGFLPRKAGERRNVLAEVADERRTMVFFEAPHRLDATLGAMVEAFGPDRRAAVCRELTKTYEEVRRGPLTELAEWAAAGDVRGEITIVVEGATQLPVDVTTLVGHAMERVDAGERLKDVTRDLAARHGVSARELYEQVLARRAGRPRDPAAGA